MGKLVKLELAGAIAPTGGVRVLLSSNFWIQWTHIALKNEAEARVHRREAVATWGQPDAGNSLGYEMECCLVAITAVAFAFEALHGDLAQLMQREPDVRKVDHPGRRRPPAWRYVFETLELASPPVGRYRSRFADLQTVRGHAVHFISAQRDPVPHAELPTRIGPENVMFSVETTRWTIDMLLEILRLATTKPGHPGVATWGIAHAPVIARLLESRRQGP